MYIWMSIGLWAQVAVFTHAMVILNCLGQVLYLGRALRTKETMLDFPEWCRVTRHQRLFHGLTGSQRTPGFWGITLTIEREIEDAWSTRDMGVSSKREDHPSSSLGKRQKTSASHEFQDQGQDGAFSQVGQMICYLC